jgi:hypothetical protein
MRDMNREQQERAMRGQARRQDLIERRAERNKRASLY